jgi:hypothetical protein
MTSRQYVAGGAAAIHAAISNTVPNVKLNTSRYLRFIPGPLGVFQIIKKNAG